MQTFKLEQFKFNPQTKILSTSKTDLFGDVSNPLVHGEFKIVGRTRTIVFQYAPQHLDEAKYILVFVPNKETPQDFKDLKVFYDMETVG